MARFVLSLVVVAALVQATGASAETFRVTQHSDANGACGDRCSLREGVQTAVDQAGDDRVKLRKGRYELTIGGPGEDSSEGGDLDVRFGDTLTVAGAGMRKTVIDANRIDRVFNTIGEVTLVLEDLTVTGGKGKEGGEGAGLEIESQAVATLSRTKVSGNKTAKDQEYAAAGIYVGPSAELTLNRSVVSGNVNYTGDGGGILNSGDLSVIKSTVSKNMAMEGNGAGISLLGADSFLLDASTVSGNRAGQPETGGDGGGIYAPGMTTVSTIVNSTISFNDARGPSSQAGGILIAGEAGFTNSTVTDNSSTADEAGGIWGQTGAEVRLFNTIISNNFGSSLAENCGGNLAAFNSQGHNLENLDSCQLSGPQDQFDTVARLGPLKDNGGPTLTIALRRGSPAINTANLIGCPDRDQRGVNRPRGPTCDIGAYER